VILITKRYEKESTKVGKASFAFAWVLDETGEERNRYCSALCVKYWVFNSKRIIKNKNLVGIDHCHNKLYFPI